MNRKDEDEKNKARSTRANPAPITNGAIGNAQTPRPDLTVRKSEQTRQLKNQWDDGFEARSRFNHQQPKSVRAPGRGFQRTTESTDLPTTLGTGARRFVGDITEEMTGALDFAARAGLAAGQPIARTAQAALTGEAMPKRNYMDSKTPMPWSDQATKDAYFKQNAATDAASPRLNALESQVAQKRQQLEQMKGEQAQRQPRPPQSSQQQQQPIQSTQPSQQSSQQQQPSQQSQPRQPRPQGAMDYATGRRASGPSGAFYNSLTRPPGERQELKDRSTASKTDNSTSRGESTSSRRANPQVLKRLMQLTNSRNGHVAVAATRALGQIGMMSNSNKYDSAEKAIQDNRDSIGYYETPDGTSAGGVESDPVPLFRDTGGMPPMGVDPGVANSVRQSILEYKRAGKNPQELLNSEGLTQEDRNAFWQLINPEAITYDPAANQYRNDPWQNAQGMAEGGQVPLPEDLMGTPEDALLGGMDMGGGGAMMPPDALGGALGGDEEGSLEEVDALMQMAMGGGEGNGDPMDASGATVVDPMLGDQAPTDSIPAVVDGQAPVNLDSGEFVIPKDVVMYFGTEKLQKMIDKARQGAGQAPDQGAGQAPDQSAEMPANA